MKLKLDCSKFKIDVSNLHVDLKKVKTCMYVVGVLVVIIGSQLFINYKFKDEGKMLEAFANTKSQAIKSELKVVGTLGSRYMTLEDKKNLIEFVAGHLGIDSNMTYTETNGDKTTCITGTKNAKSADTNIELISVDMTNESNKRDTVQYLTVTLTIYEKTDSILAYKKMIEQSLEELNVTKYDTSITLEGAYKKQLTLEEKNQISNEIMETLQGKIVTDHRADSLFTVYAYTPLVRDYITSEGKRVNINIAFSYDEFNDKTLIYVASPILNSDY